VASEHGGEGGGGHGGGSAERYIITYADLLTLLLAFFIVMYATSKADLDKFSKIATALNQAFGVGVINLGSGSGSSGLLPGGTGAIAFPRLSQRSRDYIFLSQQITAFAQEAGMLPEIGINMRKEGIVISLSTALLFPSGGTEISEESRLILDRLAELLRPLPNELRVEAHTDDLPTNDPLMPTNWELSAMRAVAVARYLIEEGGIAPERLATAGYGEYRPLFPNDTREHRMLNRRADILILYPAEEPTFAMDVLSLPNIKPTISIESD
jgi:chemotaxis protein MotB